MKRLTGSVLALLTTIGLSLTGCGGGGSPGTAGTTATAVPTVSGVAATGVPMSGTVYLKDAAGHPEIATSINPQTGAFCFNVSGKTPPFMIKAGTLYSMCGGTGTANINPLSHLVVVNMGGFGNMSTMNAFYRNPSGTAMHGMFANISTAKWQMWQTMDPLLTAYGAHHVDPISSPYRIGVGLDWMFDHLSMTISQNGTVTMTNTSGGTIYTGEMCDMWGGTLIAGNIGQPGTGQTSSGVTITPTSALLPVYRTLQFSANIPVTWSVGLNSGTITSGGLYTAPGYQGMFAVKATSLADPTKFSTATVFVGDRDCGSECR